jgi:opacity protein-like surface antigen
MAPVAPNPRETTMLRKFSLVAVAAVSLAAAALAPTSASAWGGWHGGWHHGWGWGGPRFFVGGPAYGYGGCYVRQLVPTPWGPRWRLFNRCN